ncbi:hypothetical protein LY76DRAFT_378713 [Colletotrichum caudatum]|nr:hypothetical protein LY76DRAFT_378713 [Colletotrichum caudatum]
MRKLAERKLARSTSQAPARDGSRQCLELVCWELREGLSSHILGVYLWFSKVNMSKVGLVGRLFVSTRKREKKRE